MVDGLGIHSLMTVLTTLLANHYYQPTNGSQPPCDSFIFNPEGAQFILFRVTCGLTHPVRLKGINALIDLATQLGVNDLTLHFVAVVPEGDRVEFPVHKIQGFYDTPADFQMVQVLLQLAAAKTRWGQ